METQQTSTKPNSIKEFLFSEKIPIILFIPSILVGLLGLVLIVLSHYSNAGLLDQIAQYKLQEKAFTIKRLSDSSTIVTQAQTQLTQSEALKLHLVTLEDNMKKLQAQISSSTVAHFDNVDVPFIPSGYIDTTGKNLIDTTGLGLIIASHQFKSEDTGTIKVPQLFYHGKSTGDTLFETGGYVGKKGIHFDSLNVFNKQIISVGEKLKNNSFFYRINPFKTYDPVVTIHNSNPHVIVTGMDNVVIKPKKTTANKVWQTIKSAALVFTGYTLLKK